MLNDPEAVTRQYATEVNLETRRSVWQPGPDGRDAGTVALAAVAAEVAAGGTRVLEVGCGTGVFAEWLRGACPGAEVLATDQSARFVELTAARGVQARRADVMDLPLADASYDVVVALWMLYHVPDLDRGLRELARVLRPGGLLVAVTNGDEHMASLRRDAGGGAVLTRFSSENGAVSLARHFTDVRRDDLASRAVFDDHAGAMAYLESSQEDIAWDLPWFDGPREYAGATTVFTARRRPVSTSRDPA